MSLSNIAMALQTQLYAMPSALPTTGENAEYTPPPGAYQRINMLPAPPANPTVGSGFYREIGLMQVTLFYPLGGGGAAAYAMAEAIQAWFARGSSFSNGGVTVRIASTPAIGPGSSIEDRFVLPVSVRYFANIVLP